MKTKRELLTASLVSLAMAIMVAAILSWSVAGCGNVDCTAAHSVFVFADDDVMNLHSCDDWESATQQFIRDFSAYAQAEQYAMPPSKVASAIYGITMNVVTKSFPCSAPFGCSGFAYLDTKHIDLAIHPELCEMFPDDVSCKLCDPKYSAYFHELSHFVMCEGLGMCHADKENNWNHDHYLMKFESSYFNTCGKE